MSSGCWRIDELAQRAGLTVDTIRYYAREGLLAPPDAGPEIRDNSAHYWEGPLGAARR